MCVYVSERGGEGNKRKYRKVMVGIKKERQERTMGNEGRMRGKREGNSRLLILREWRVKERGEPRVERERESEG